MARVLASSERMQAKTRANEAQLFDGGSVAGGQSCLEGEAGYKLLAAVSKEEIVRRERALGFALRLGPCPALVGGGWG